MRSLLISLIVLVLISSPVWGLEKSIGGQIAKASEQKVKVRVTGYTGYPFKKGEEIEILIPRETGICVDYVQTVDGDTIDILYPFVVYEEPMITPYGYAAEKRELDKEKGAPIRVRLIGVDTPERGKPFYQEAKEAIDKIVAGKKLFLIFEEDFLDDYGRLLAHVFTEDNIYVNGWLAQQKFTEIECYPPNCAFNIFLQLLHSRKEVKK